MFDYIRLPTPGQNGGSSLTQDLPLWWTLHGASQLRSTEEKIQRPSKEIPVSLPHRSLSVVSPCRWPRSLTTRCSPVSLLLWEQPERKNRMHRLSTNPRLVIPLQQLWQSVPVMYWPCQPPANLHQTWTTPLIFVCEIQTKHSYIFTWRMCCTVAKALQKFDP